MKNNVEKKLCYLKSSKEFLWKDVFLNKVIVQNKNSCVLTLNHPSGGTLFHQFLFKEFSKKRVVEEKVGRLLDFQNNYCYPLLDESFIFDSKSSWEWKFSILALDGVLVLKFPYLDYGMNCVDSNTCCFHFTSSDFFFKAHFKHHLPFKRESFQILGFHVLLLEFEKDACASLQYYLNFFWRFEKKGIPYIVL